MARKKKSKQHRVTSVRTAYTIECGACGKEFGDESEDAMSHSYPMELEEGTPLDCPECGEELDVTFEEEE